MSRAFTEEEVRNQLLDHIRHLSSYWAAQHNQSPKERCDGLAFSILNIFDGTSAALPAFDIVLAPHPDDKAFHQSEGENWYEPGMVINDCMLHEQFYRNDTAAEAGGQA